MRCAIRQPGDKWHLDEVFIRIQGVQHYLWRAVDQHGVVLDILVQEKRWRRCKAFLQTPAEGIAVLTEADHHRRSTQLGRRRTRSAAERETSHQPLSKQSG